jgi:transcription termination factor Rho
LQNININEYNLLPLKDLVKKANSIDIENAQNFSKPDLIFEIVTKETEDKEIDIYFNGILDIMQDGYGFLSPVEFPFTNTALNIYVSQNQIRKNSLRNGDEVKATVRLKNAKEKYSAATNILSVNGSEETQRNRPLFENLTPIYPTRRIKLEKSPNELTGRFLDLFIPIGFGQRALIVAPPKTGKTEMLKSIANAITQNHPEAKLKILLIDERPEEVTDIQNTTKAEVFSSTFDEPTKKHVKLSEQVLEKAKREAEQGEDVIILLDSITRLARAYNQEVPSSGKVLSGGVDAAALHKPKRFFGAARNIEGGGSLTIIATALVDTGSKMDEVIFEEFKGTGNSEIILTRELSNQRVFPAIDIVKSGTRKDELLYTQEEFDHSIALRTGLMRMDGDYVSNFNFIKGKIKNSKTNKEFYSMMKS